MSLIKQCDKCGTTVGVSAMVTVERKRKCCNQHDGEYVTSVTAEYDLCEKCAREVELIFVSAEEADGIMFT